MVAQIKKYGWQVIGALGATASLIIYIKEPSFPTPDKLVIFLTFVFMIFRQATSMLKRLLPFVVLILVYESFRGIADNLNTHVNFSLPPAFDRYIFGDLPTTYLQNWLWSGHVHWYDFVFYIPYMLFFVFPLVLAILIWKTREQKYWQFMSTYLVLFFAAFLTFLLFPAAPPWMASDQHYIQPIVRISSDVWAALGIHDFPSLYSKIAPNPVAAVPSLHAGASTLFAIFIFKLYGKKWGLASLIYPILIYVGVIYQGEHYFFDIFVGVLYAIIAYLLTPKLLEFFKKILLKIKNSSSTKSALRSSR